MKHVRKFFLLSCISTFFLIQNGFAQFSVDAQLRSRFEIRDGYQKLAAEGLNPAVFISQRTRLSFSYESKLLKVKVTPQDVRIWGDQAMQSSTGVGDNPSLDLLEAYAELKIGNNGWISAGRQQLVYDNKRLLGDRNWNQTGISYDAVVLKLLAGTTNIHAGAVWNTLLEPTSENYYPTSRIKSLNYLWANRKFNDHLTLSFLHISSGVTETDTTNALNFRHTTGFYGEYKSGNFNVWGDAYYQYGKNQKGNQISAYLIDADAGYKLGNFTPGLGVGYLSGNNSTVGTDGTDNLFDPLYGNRHKFFGAMDFYRSFASQTKQGGLSDIYLWLDYKFSKKVSLRNTIHHFALAQANPATPEDKDLGIENDLILKYKINEWGDLESGYCFYIPTETLKEIQSIPEEKFSQFFYIQLNINLNLFKQAPSSEK
ncbi:MAG: alginate export family protein [Bacteroidales bacterium]|nr:alginate export family protein [Bacteroidales bacterium]